jgi:hypothetical protein
MSREMSHTANFSESSLSTSTRRLAPAHRAPASDAIAGQEVEDVGTRSASSGLMLPPWISISLDIAFELNLTVF